VKKNPMFPVNKDSSNGAMNSSNVTKLAIGDGAEPSGSMEMMDTWYRDTLYESRRPSLN
jgi:hypothetical protein